MELSNLYHPNVLIFTIIYMSVIAFAYYDSLTCENEICHETIIFGNMLAIFVAVVATLVIHIFGYVILVIPAFILASYISYLIALLFKRVILKSSDN